VIFEGEELERIEADDVVTSAHAPRDEVGGPLGAAALLRVDRALELVRPEDHEAAGRCRESPSERPNADGGDRPRHPKDNDRK